MSLRNYFNFFSIVVILANFLFFGASSQAFAQQGAVNGEKNPKQVKILIDNFEAIAPIPEGFKYLERGGPTMLRTALIKAASIEEHVSFAFVERSKLNKILQEGGGIQQKLTAVFDQTKVKDELKGEGADYVIFVSYFAQGGNHIRADARMVNVEEVAAEISEFHVFAADHPDPLQPLADKLVNSYLDKILKKKSLLPESFELCVLSFKYEGPESWETIKEITPNHIMSLLLMSKVQKMKCISADELTSANEENFSKLAELNPRIDFFIVGKISILPLEQKTIAMVNIRNVDRKSVTLTSMQTSCEPTKLIIGTDEVLKKFVEDLKNEWPKIIKKKGRD